MLFHLIVLVQLYKCLYCKNSHDIQVSLELFGLVGLKITCIAAPRKFIRVKCIFLPF